MLGSDSGLDQPEATEDSTHDDCLPKQIGTGLECSICTELFLSAVTLGCSHTFCRYCIQQWRKEYNHCPICRAKITVMVPTLIVDTLIDKIIEKSESSVREHREELQAERERLLESEELNNIPQPEATHTVNHTTIEAHQEFQTPNPFSANDNDDDDWNFSDSGDDGIDHNWDDDGGLWDKEETDSEHSFGWNGDLDFYENGLQDEMQNRDVDVFNNEIENGLQDENDEINDQLDVLSSCSQEEDYEIDFYNLSREDNYGVDDFSNDEDGYYFETLM